MDKTLLRVIIAEELTKGRYLKSIMFDNSIRKIFHNDRDESARFDIDKHIKEDFIVMEEYDMYGVPVTNYKTIDTIQGLVFATLDNFDAVDEAYLLRS